MRIAAKRGVLFRSVNALQTAHTVSSFAFDKTGTLSTGVFRIVRAEIFIDGCEWAMHDLVKTSKHPISQSLRLYLENSSEGLDHTITALTTSVEDATSIPGKGIQASLSGFPFLGGSAAFSGMQDHPVVQKLRDEGLTLFTISLGGEPVAVFGLADTPREDAQSLLAALQQRGKNVFIVSGDTPNAVRRLALEIGIPDSVTHAGCSPEDKVDFIARLRREGHLVCFGVWLPISQKCR